MQFIPVTLLSEKLTPPCVIKVPILSCETLLQRVKDLANRHAWIPVDMAWQSFIYCRELFQEQPSELFFFPYSSGSWVSLAEMNVGEIFFLRNSSSWSFTLCFHPNATARSVGKPQASRLFSEKKGYPEGVDEAASFFLSRKHMSILVSEHGSIIMDNDGMLFLKGINVFFLQKTRFSEKSILVQRKNENVSPNRSLKEGFRPLQKYKKYITVRCVCNTPGFCYSTQFPVLSAKELEQELAKDHGDRVTIYGSRLKFSSLSLLQYSFFQPPSADVKHLIMFPYKMGIEVPFGCFEGGRMFFSYAETPLSGGASGNVKITFFPSFFEAKKRLQSHLGKDVKKHFKGRKQTSFSVCNARKVTTFTPVGVKLVPISSSEFQLAGATVEMISTKIHGGWGVCFSRETINLSNIPIPGPSGIESRETQQESSRSPLPGPSGVERRRATSQATATVSVPSGEQGQQTQQKGSKSPVSGGPGRSSYAYGSSFPRAYRFSIIPCPQALFTVSVPPDRQSSPTGSSTRMNLMQLSIAKDHPYARGESEQEGSKNPVSGGPGRSSYAYGSSFPSFPRSYRFTIIPLPQALSTVSVPSDRQSSPTGSSKRMNLMQLSIAKDHPYARGESEQEGSKNPVSGGPGRSSYAYGSSFPSFPRAYRFPIIPRPQALSTVSVPPDRQSSPTGSSKRMNLMQLSIAKDHPYARDESEQEGSKNLVSGGPGRSSYAYGSFFPSLPRATAFVSPEQQGKQTQKRKHSSSVSYGIGSRAPTTQAAATVSVPPESESTQTQQEGRSSSLSGPFGIGREATASLSHAESTVVVPSEQQRQQTQQRSRSPLPDPSGVRHQVIRPTPFRSQPVDSAFMQFEQAQQRNNCPVPAPSGASFHPYPQHGPLPFSEVSRPYFYPEIGSFVGGFYPYGYPLPSFPYPAARQGQWMPVFPTSSFAVRPPVADFNPLRYEIPVQERGAGQSARAEEASASGSVGTVQQTPIWSPDEESSSAEVPSQAQADNPAEDTDLDVES